MVGINHYHASLGSLKYCVNDCRRLAEVLTRTGTVAQENLLVLADDEDAERQPRFGAIHQWLAAWLAQPEEDDTIILYFAGHGREMDGRSYLVPADASLQTLNVMGIPIAHVREQLSRCKARQKILVLDACHSGAGRDVNAMSGAMVAELSAARGIYTVTSCARDERSHEWEEKQQGVFSYYLVEALAGACLPDSNGQLTADSIYAYVYERVREWSRGTGCAQTPTRFCEGAGTIALLTAARPTATPLPPDAAADLECATQLMAEGDLPGALAATRAGLEKEKLSYELRKLEREILEAIRHRDNELESARQHQVEERITKLLADSQKFEKAGDLTSALACLEEAERLNPARVALVLESLKRRCDLGGLDTVAQLKFLFRQAEQAEQTSPEAAMAAYQEALNVYPGNKRAAEGVAQCAERIRKSRLEENVRLALGNLEEEARGLAATVTRLEIELGDYQELAMEREASQSSQELSSYLERLKRSKQLQVFLHGSLTILASAGSVPAGAGAIADHPELMAAARLIHVDQLRLNEELLDALAPGLKTARSALARWCAKVEAVLKTPELEWAEYQRQLGLEQERMKAEQVRLDLVHAARPKFLRALISPDKAKPRPIPPPPKGKAIELPPMPENALHQFGTSCRELVPPELRALLDKAEPPGWMLPAQEDGGTPTGKAPRRKTMTKTQSPKTPVDLDFEACVCRELSMSLAALNRLLRAMKEALLTLPKARGCAAVRVKIASFGSFDLSPTSVASFQHEPGLRSTSQDFRVALRARQDVDKEEIEKCVKFWPLLEQYCRNNAEGVRLGGFGRFTWEKDHSLHMKR